MKAINQIIKPLSKETMSPRVISINTPSDEWLKKSKWAFYEKAKEIVPSFQFDEYNISAITQMIIYFGGFDGDLDQKKGLFIYGPLGSGKTVIMRIFNEMMKGSENSFRFIPSTEINQIYVQSGDLDMFYRNEDGFLNRPIRLCIDELGAEAQTAKYFGSEINVLQEVLQNRYYLSQEGIRTYATSNFKPEELGVKYGDRIQDRANEMFNMILLKSNGSRRK